MVGETGSWDILARRGVADSILSITVVAGIPDRISIVMDAEEGKIFSEGEIVDLTLKILDASGNPITVAHSQIIIETEIGDAEHLQSDVWRMKIDDYGENVPITVRYLELEQTIFVTATPSALSKLTDTNMGRLALGSVSVVLLLTVMLVLLPKFRNEADEILEEGEDTVSQERSAPSPPPAGVAFNAPPSSAFSTSSRRRGRHISSSMVPSWDASQARQNSANMMAMGATNSVTQQSQTSPLPQSNFEQTHVADPVTAPPRPKGLDEEENTLAEPISPETEEKQESVSSGVMLACDGTIQGQTGWYHDGIGNTSYWQVDEVGTWTRLK